MTFEERMELAKAYHKRTEQSAAKIAELKELVEGLATAPTLADLRKFLTAVKDIVEEV